MKRVEAIFYGLILGAFSPLSIALGAVGLWFNSDRIEDRAPWYLLSGLAAGFLIDAIYLRGWLRHRYDLPVWFVATIFCLYNILAFGFFMGFPVFHVLGGPIAGFYFAQRIIFQKIPAEGYNRIMKRVSAFTGLMMAIICVASGTIALVGTGAGDDIQGMLGLSFVPAKSMILLVSTIGGLFLITVQVILTRRTMIWMIRQQN